jgi:DNA-binding transcriptional MerR regulator
METISDEGGVEPMLTTDDVARICRTSPSTVRYWRHTGYGPPGFRAGRRVLYRSCDVATWLTDKAEQDVTHER